MPWAWSDMIDADTDLQDLTLWNRLIEAIRKRWLCSGDSSLYGIFTAIPVAAPDAGDDSVVIPPGEPNRYIFNDPEDPQADLTAAGITITDYPTPNFSVRSIREMQNTLTFCTHRYINLEAAPAALQGINFLDEAAYVAAFWNPATLAASLGHPSTGTWLDEWALSTVPGNAYTFPIFLRRRHPRRIDALDAARSILWTDLGTGFEMPLCVAGNRAQYYDELEHYHGVYEYDGTDWTEAAPGVLADELDSDESEYSNGWTPPGFFLRGDYVGWWLAKDLHEVAKRFTSSIMDVTFSHPPGGTDIANAAKSAPNQENVSKAAARAAADAVLAAATPVLTSGFQKSSLSWDVFGDGSYWIANQEATRADLVTDLAYGGAAKVIDFYALPYSPGIDNSYFDANGEPFTADAYSLWTSKAAAATGHELQTVISDTVGSYAPATYHDDLDGIQYGYYILNVYAVARWTFSD